jgi:steroid delta-isomerase-like uncharacterized protein
MDNFVNSKEPTMTNPNADLARRWFEEVWNERRSETIYELLTRESVCRSEAGPLKGPEDFLNYVYKPLISALPDLRVKIEGIISEGEQVAVRWLATGTHTADGMGMPASGSQVSFRGMTWIRFSNGKFAEGWDSYNQDGLLDALRGGSDRESVTKG